MQEMVHQRDCCGIVQLVDELLNGRAQEMTVVEGKRILAEKRIVELTEGLKEAMVLFAEREESFDSLAGINKELERKVSNEERIHGHRRVINVYFPLCSSINWSREWRPCRMPNSCGVNIA